MIVIASPACFSEPLSHRDQKLFLNHNQLTTPYINILFIFTSNLLTTRNLWESKKNTTNYIKVKALKSTKISKKTEFGS